MPKSRWGLVIAVLLAAVLVLVAAPWFFDSVVSHSRNLGFHIAVALFGMLVGAGEILVRYKDAPFLIVRSPAAVVYIAINGLAALSAYALILEFDWSFNAEGPHKRWVQAFVAGFGAMAFFRSSLFTARVGQQDIPVGPGILLQSFLFAVDREVDRHRAWHRSALVTSIMRGVSYAQARDVLPTFCFELMQNLPSTEQEYFDQTLRDLDGLETMLDSDKALNMGLMLMNIVGSDVLMSAVRELGPRIQRPATLDIKVFSALQGAEFDRAYPVLVDICFIMSKLGTTEEQQFAKAAVVAEIEPLKARIDLGDDTKIAMLALSLQQRVGDAVLAAALVLLGDSIKRRPIVAIVPAGPPADNP